MNDPGTEEPIRQAAEEIEPTFDGAGKEDDKQIEEQQHNLHDSNLWWFASTGCPLLAGTFGPLANAFSICALATSWRVYIAPGETEASGNRINDPGWLLAVNAVSLVIALAANAALLMNMSGRVRFKIAQPISVIGFFIGGLLLVIITAVLSNGPDYYISRDSPAAPAGAHALTQAYYYAIEAAVIYWIITILMSLTAYGAWKGHFEAEFRLTLAQRTLMLQTMMFVTYLMIGAVVFSHVEGWEYLDALYWADLTVLTIGLGSDFHPSTHTGRTLYLFFAIGGIVIIGLVIGSIRTLVLDRGKKKVSARMMEKKRLRAINSVDPRKHRIQISRFQTMRFDNDDLTPAKRREFEFKVMRSVQECAERDRKWMSLVISTFAAACLWFIGAAVFYVTERDQDWTYFASLYFSYTCLLTIGYGDLYPESNSGKAFFVLWTLLAIPTLTILISNMGDTVVAVFSNAIIWIGSITVLPGEKSMSATAKRAFRQLADGRTDPRELESATKTTAPGIFGESAREGGEEPKHIDLMTNNIAERLSKLVEDEEINEAIEAQNRGDSHERDVHFYHFVLAKEIRSMMQDLSASPPKQYSWAEWEYYLKLMDNEAMGSELVPDTLRNPTSISKFKLRKKDQQWSWLSDRSPLMGFKSETEWILERLGATLEQEIQEQRKKLNNSDYKERKPPVSLAEMVQMGVIKPRGGSESTAVEKA